MSARNGWLFGLTCGFTCVVAHAGVYVERVVRNTETKVETPGVNMYIENGMARIEDLQGKRPHVTIFKDEAVYVLEPAKKTYTVMDKAAVDKMSGQMGDAMQKMQAELANMPPEQRAMVEQMMKQNGAGAPGMGPPGAGDSTQHVTTSSDAGKSESVNGRSCHVWNIKRDNVLTSQLCVVPYASLPGAGDMRDVLVKLSAMMEKLTESLKQFGSVPGEEFAGMNRVNGMPVLTRKFTDGKADPEETIVKEWTTRSNAADLFNVPSDYKRLH
jgi:hypothetical protein